jgi:hypothetical protein
MSKIIGSSKRSRSAGDSSMLTEILRRTVESQNFRDNSARAFLRPLFSNPPSTTITSGNSAVLAEARTIDPNYPILVTSSTTEENVLDTGVETQGTVGDLAFALGNGLNGELTHAKFDSSDNIYALVRGGDSRVKTPINQYAGVSDGKVLRSIWGYLKAGEFITGVNNLYFVKYTSTGVPLWATTIKTSLFTLIARSLQVDSSGNIYILFGGEGTITFNNYTSGGGSGTDIILSAAATTSAAAGSTDLFLCKYNTSGQFQWCTMVTSSGGVGGGSTKSLALDSLGNLYYPCGSGGMSSNSLQFRSFSSISGGVVQYTSFGTDSLSQLYRGFVTKTNSNGVVQWVSRITSKTYPLTQQEIQGIVTNQEGTRIAVTTRTIGSNGLAIDNFSNVDVSGIITYMSTNSTSSPAGSSGRESYVATFNGSGSAVWVNRQYSTNNAIITPIFMDTSQNIYVGGDFLNTLVIQSAGTLGSGNITMSDYGTLSHVDGQSSYIIKYDMSGICKAATSITMSTNRLGYLTDIACDSLQRPYGCYEIWNVDSNAVTINSFVSSSGNGQPISLSTYGNTQSISLRDALYIKYNTSLAVQWVARIDQDLSGPNRERPGTIVPHPTSNYVLFGGWASNRVNVPLRLWNASGVSGGVIQYSQYATMSLNVSGTSGIGSWLVKYT